MSTLPPPDAQQWRPSEHCDVPMMSTLQLQQRVAGYIGAQADARAAGHWSEIVANHTRWTEMLGGGGKPLSPGAVQHLVDMERHVNDTAATVLGVRATLRKRRRRNSTDPNAHGAAGGSKTMPWDVGHTKHRAGTGIAVAQRAMEDPIGELARHTVQPMQHLGGEIRMCCAPTCRRETEFNRCVACKGADLTDHMCCTGCPETAAPSELHLDTQHVCGGSWQPCDGMSYACGLCGGPAGPVAKRVAGWLGWTA